VLRRRISFTPSSSFFSPSFQPVPELNIGLHPAPMLYLKSEMHNPSRPRGPSACDAPTLPEPNESVPLAGSAASPVYLPTIARFASQNFGRSAQPTVHQLLTPTPVMHTTFGFCVTNAPGRRKPGTDTKFPAQFAGNWLSVPGFAPRDMLPARRAPKTAKHPRRLAKLRAPPCYHGSYP
jgi:hypothetical protein